MTVAALREAGSTRRNGRLAVVIGGVMFSKLRQRKGEAEMGIGVRRSERNGLAKSRNGFAEMVLRRQTYGQIECDDRVIRIDLERLSEMPRRFRDASGFLQYRAEIVMCLAAARIRGADCGS